MFIILITLDCMRKDHFGREHAPRFAEQSGEWVSFEKAYSQSQNTLSSHFTMLTSNYLFQHGVYSNFSGKNLPGHSIDKHLRAAGFDTAAFCGVSFLQNLLGDQVGEKDPYFDFSGNRLFGALKRRLNGERRRAEKVFSKGLRWLLDKNGKNDRFLWLHLFDAHMPYEAPAPLMKKSLPPGRAERSVREQLEEKGWFSPYFREYEKKVPLEYFPRSYGAAVGYIDQAMDDFFSVLKSLGMFSDSLVFVTSDHGECLMGDHGVYCAHKKLFRETVHVPFFVKFPGGAFAGQKRWEIAEHTDIAPTIAALIGREEKNYMGIDLMKLAAGKAAPRENSFAEHVDNFMRSFRDGRTVLSEVVPGAENKWKMRMEDGSLFTEDSLPLEDPGTERAMREKMKEFMEACSARCSVAGTDSERSDEIEQQLRGLGYL